MARDYQSAAGYGGRCTAGDERVWQPVEARQSSDLYAIELGKCVEMRVAVE